MAKLEELSELLASEIRDFEDAVKHLKEIQKTKITIDIAELKQVLSNHRVDLKNQILAVQKVQMQLENSLMESKIYTKWVVLVFIVSLLLNFVFFVALLK